VPEARGAYTVVAEGKTTVRSVQTITNRKRAVRIVQPDRCTACFCASIGSFSIIVFALARG
jgi:hypothetical protein